MNAPATASPPARRTIGSLARPSSATRSAQPPSSPGAVPRADAFRSGGRTGYFVATAAVLLSGTMALGAPPPPTTKFQFEYDGDFLGNISGGLKRGAVYDGYLKLGGTVGFGNPEDWKEPDGKREFALHASIIYPHGRALSQDYVGDLNGVSGYYSDPSLRLFSLWAQKEFFECRLSLRVGIWALDKGSGFWQSEGAGTFVNGGFGTFPIFANDLVAAVFPVSAPCVRLQWEPVKNQLKLRTAVFSGDVGMPADNRHNTLWHLRARDGVAVFAEAEYRQKSDHGRLPGTYKVGGFYDSNSFDDLRGGVAHHGNYGFYVTADQQVWLKHRKKSGRDSGKNVAGDDDNKQGLAVFGKLALVPRDRNFVRLDTEAGLTYTGLFEGRPDDVLGLGVAYSNVSPNARDNAGQPFSNHSETVLELTYQWHVTKWETDGKKALGLDENKYQDGLTVLVQPDFQYIINPGAVSCARNAVVAGLRVTVRF